MASVLRLAGAKPGGRFVDEEDLRVHDQRDGKVEPPAHATRVRADSFRSSLGQSELLQQLVGSAASRPDRKPAEPTEHHQVLQAGHLLIDGGVLANKPDSPAPDLVRSIYLLWGHHPSPGRSGLSVSAIVKAGIEIADADGLDATSMRKVAERLGVGTMSLYTHVPGKDDLTALMVDAVYAELYNNDVEAAARVGDWRDAVRFIAERNWDLYARHPWLLDLRSSRLTVGPSISRKYETELRPLDGIGLSDVEMDAALTLILSLVDATARARRSSASTRDDSGMSDAEWWGIVAPVLEQVMTDDSLTVSARVGSAVGAAFDAAQNPAHALAFGLDTILDGIQARIQGRLS